MPNLDLETPHYPLIVAGVDEAGRGPLVSSVYAAAVIVDQNHIIHGIDDSKKIPEIVRESLYEEIIKHYAYGVGFATNQEIDEINILQATKLACRRAIDNLPIVPDIVLIDGNMKFEQINYHSIIKGDSLSISIAAASIVAKVTRDRVMRELSKDFPEYGWESNKGYGTKAHIEAIRRHGITEHHRRSFRSNRLPA